MRDVATVDLAPLASAFGDVVSVALVATDIAGQTTISAPCRILISPRSMDSRAERRSAALKAARELTESSLNDLGDSAAAVRATLRAIAAVDSPLASNYLQQQLDTLQQVTSAMTWNGQTQWNGDQANALRNAAAALKTLESSELAKSILADRENIDAAEKVAPDASVAEKAATRQSVQRAKREVAQRIQSLQLAPDAADTPQRLAQIAAAGDAAANGAHPPSAAALTRDWAGSKGAAADVARDRVAVAAQAEALRGDADLSWARDLQLLARAMTAVAHQPSPADQVRAGVADAAAALESAHQDMAAARSSPAASKKADEARQALARLAGDPAQSAATQPSMFEESLATPAELQQEHDQSPAGEQASPDHQPEKWNPHADANAKSQDGNDHPGDTPDERQARSIDRAAKSQKRLGDRTKAATDGAAKSLAMQQQDVAQELKRIEAQRDEDFFQQPGASPADQQQMLEQLRQMQRDLANLPQQMLQARSAAQAAGAQKSESAQAGAQREADALAQAGRSLSGKRPPGSGGAAQTSAMLGDSVKALSDQLAKGDLSSADAAQAKALESVAALQATLRSAQRQVVDRDPVVAARYFAERAAAELAREPPDLMTARADQQAASGALERAWGQSMQRAVHDRLGRLPSFQSLLDDDLPLMTAGGTAPAMLARSATPQWGRLRNRRSNDVDGTEGEFQPAGYEGALSAYFDALGKARASGGGK